MSENDRPWKRDVEKAQHLQAKRGGYRAIADEGHHLYVEGRPCDAGDLGTSRLANMGEYNPMKLRRRTVRDMRVRWRRNTRRKKVCRVRV